MGSDMVVDLFFCLKVAVGGGGDKVEVVVVVKCVRVCGEGSKEWLVLARSSSSSSRQ
jgi:hypothetical protein